MVCISSKATRRSNKQENMTHNEGENHTVAANLDLTRMLETAGKEIKTII